MCGLHSSHRILRAVCEVLHTHLPLLIHFPNHVDETEIAINLRLHIALETEMFGNVALCSRLQLQVGQPPILQAHVADAPEVDEVVIGTQIPIALAKTCLKRLRKERQLPAFAEGETTPNPRRSGRSENVSSQECGFADRTLQTPMPESEAGSAFGPPPPDSTPPPQRGKFRFLIASAILHEYLWRWQL